MMTKLHDDAFLKMYPRRKRHMTVKVNEQFTVCYDGITTVTVT